jgi:hypothetical protein
VSTPTSQGDHPLDFETLSLENSLNLSPLFMSKVHEMMTQLGEELEGVVGYFLWPSFV